MNNPVDDNSPSGNHSLLDDFIQSLSLDSHQYSNSQPSEVPDLSPLQVNLGETPHLQDVQSAGTLDGSDSSGHSLIPSGWDGGHHHNSSETKAEWTGDNFAQQDFAPSSDVGWDSTSTHHESHTSFHPSDHHTLHWQGEAAPQVLNYTNSGAITSNDDNAIYFDGNNVWWHGYGWGKAGTVDGHKFYRDDKCIGRLGADLNVYNSNGNKIGYVTPAGCAYSTDGKLFATGATARWAAATLVFNTCTQ